MIKDKPLHKYGARFKEQKKISLHNERMRLVFARCGGRLICPYCYQPTCQCDTGEKICTSSQ